jgi:glucosamine-6-phosphate deaminase
MDTQIFAARQEMGTAAAQAAADFLRHALSEREIVRAVFAAAPSQYEMLSALVEAEGIDWHRIEAFHMDEYIGLDSTAPQRFAQFLQDRLFNRLPFRAVHLIDPSVAEPVEQYEKLLKSASIDLVCLGIGENGHLAFNDPPVADFADLVWVKIVELDATCRQQQVNDGCFAAFDDVPRQAITLTIPALFSGRRLICTVPGPTKRQAVFRTLHDPISTACPATVLRNHAACTLFLDRESAALLPPRSLGKG